MKWLKTKTWRNVFALSGSLITTGTFMFFTYGGVLGTSLCATLTTTGVLVGIVAWFKGWLFGEDSAGA